MDFKKIRTLSLIFPKIENFREILKTIRLEVKEIHSKKMTEDPNPTNLKQMARARVFLKTVSNQIQDQIVEKSFLSGTEINRREGAIRRGVDIGVKGQTTVILCLEIGFNQREKYKTI